MTRMVTVDSGPFIEIEFDCVVSFGDRVTAEVTKHPIETGSIAADHIILQPRSYNLKIVFSNTPLAPVIDWVSPDFAIGTVTGGITSTLPNRAEALYDLLVRMVGDRRLVSVEDPLILTTAPARADGQMIFDEASSGLFAITAVSTTKTSETMGGVELDLSLEEVKTVTSRLSTLPKSDLATRRGAKDTGKTDKETPDAAQQQRAEVAGTTMKDTFDPSTPGDP